jgi:hypothetical protein
MKNILKYLIMLPCLASSFLSYAQEEKKYTENEFKAKLNAEVVQAG